MDCMRLFGHRLQVFTTFWFPFRPMGLPLTKGNPNLAMDEGAEIILVR